MVLMFLKDMIVYMIVSINVTHSLLLIHQLLHCIYIVCYLFTNYYTVYITIVSMVY